MSEALTVTVTETDIERGQRAGFGSCPLELALERALPEAERLKVYRSFAAAWVGGKRWTALLPPECEEFVRDFEKYYPVTAFESELTFREDA